FAKVVFNPYPYYRVRGAGYGTAAGVTFHRYYVGEVLRNVFDKGGGTIIDAPEVPAYTRLDGNFPNPFNPKTTIRFATANAGDVNLTVYDITGRAVKVLVDGHMDAAPHEVVWDGTDNNGYKTASGVYFYKLHADSKVFTDKMVLLK
ncbi:T9SS type A sorting domain-containing protein, partial [bacterium]|nr:T9SS type A sorting domain-containing protein [bacterium]